MRKKPTENVSHGFKCGSKRFFSTVGTRRRIGWVYSHILGEVLGPGVRIERIMVSSFSGCFRRSCSKGACSSRISLTAATSTICTLCWSTTMILSQVVLRTPFSYY